LLAGGAGWLAVVVALNAVVGLAYYVRVVTTLFALAPSDARVTAAKGRSPLPWPVAVGLAALTLAGLVAGLAPQLVLDAASLAAGR
jgi:NADH-quinone oxidoreductase subunit N